MLKSVSVDSSFVKIPQHYIKTTLNQYKLIKILNQWVLNDEMIFYDFCDPKG